MRKISIYFYLTALLAVMSCNETPSITYWDYLDGGHKRYDLIYSYYDKHYNENFICMIEDSEQMNGVYYFLYDTNSGELHELLNCPNKIIEKKDINSGKIKKIKNPDWKDKKLSFKNDWERELFEGPYTIYIKDDYLYFAGYESYVYKKRQ